MACHERENLFRGFYRERKRDSANIILLRHEHGIAGNFVCQTRTGRDRGGPTLHFFALSRSITNSSRSLAVLYLEGAIDF